MASKEPPKRERLTLEKLIQYDDVITDALVDKVHYWTTIRKNHGGRFTASRGLREEDIANILRKSVILDKDINEAMQRLIQLPGLKKYINGLKDVDREHFTRHLRRYVSIYMPECPFEVTTTNRYTIIDHEASITARRNIDAREEIKFLTGVQVAMTEQQEQKLELARKDFSLVISSRKKTRSLFLGPARFANHDCDPNARLSTKGYDGMQVVAVKPIAEGEEITVSYGEDYFGNDNEECLCQTCEDRQVNGWAPYRQKDQDTDDEEEEQKHEGRKKDCAEVNLVSEVNSTDQEAPCLNPRKRKHITTEELATNDPISLKRARTDSNGHREEGPSLSGEEATANIARELRSQQRVGLLDLSVDETSSSRNTTPASSNSAASPKSSQSTDATSVDEDHPMSDKNIIKIDIHPVDNHAETAIGAAVIKDEVESVAIAAPWAPLFADDSSSEISELSDGLDLDNVLQKIVKRKKPKMMLPPRNTRSTSRNEVVGTPIPDAYPSAEGWEENSRKPGDYMTSRSLLSGKDSKWAECQTCEEDFVQQDGHRGTRKECPRCERHSILYGYAWPKTEKEGKHDREERILDHRTIHRFVDADEEKTLKKGRGRTRGLKSIVERYSTPHSGRGSSISTTREADSGHSRRKRFRKTM
ncbi:unnamed protein product [Periconia digitata]|uniref:Histone-lysine N-methyltransferase SET9 n=1 Tax=Periconia digitata TaxID=1303443 RepID=A0A9W4UMI6_9PLEO|nr:unnamed protein product [Periconia digitata]